MREIEAIYEKGVLKPLKKLKLKEGERVRIKIYYDKAEKRKKLLKNLKPINVGKILSLSDIKRIIEEKYEDFP
ncbi:MAG: antitoxin AF2212-like protein [Candidatus Aenigmatarchaeota archaeon]